MSTTLFEWGRDWGINPNAITDLRNRMGYGSAQVTPGIQGPATSEAGVQARVRLHESRQGNLFYRNNCGACMDSNGNFIRYGLANDSKKINEKIKSSDLIGITQHVVAPQDVGHMIGVFTAIECKAPGWTYKGDDHELAQRKFGEIIVAKGGIFRFTT